MKDARNTASGVEMWHSTGEMAQRSVRSPVAVDELRGKPQRAGEFRLTPIWGESSQINTPVLWPLALLSSSRRIRFFFCLRLYRMRYLPPDFGSK